MKARSLFMAMLAVLAMAVCSCGSKEKTPETPEALVGVIILDNDTTFRPDKAVNYVTVLDFNYKGCIPCKRIAPAVEKAAENFEGQVEFYSVDMMEYPETAAAFGVENAPEVVVMKADGSYEKYVGLEAYISADEREGKDSEEIAEIIYNTLEGQINKALGK